MKKSASHHGDHATAVMDTPPEPDPTLPDPTPEAEPAMFTAPDQPAVAPLVNGVQSLAASANITTIKRQPTTHFTGPIESGLQSPSYTAGLAELIKRFDFDCSLGPVPSQTIVNLPPNAILIDMVTIIFTPLSTEIDLTIGTTPGGNNLLALDALTAVVNSSHPILPIATPSPTTIYLNMSPATTMPTSGRFTLLLRYSRM